MSAEPATTICPCRDCGGPVEAYRRAKGYTHCTPCATKRHAKSEARAREKRDAILAEHTWQCAKCESFGVSISHTLVRDLCDWCAVEVAKHPQRFAEWVPLLREKL